MGWVASVIARSTRQHRWLWPENSIIGIIGALLGGAPFSLISRRQPASDRSVMSLILAVMGAVVLVVV